MSSVARFEIPERDLAAGEVHVWSLSLDIGQSSLVNLAEILSPDERERACRFRLEALRNRFVAGRGVLRLILGRYCDHPPERLRFIYGLHGKPELTPDTGPRPAGVRLHFNLAHSAGMGLLAITQAGPVGVDVEQVRRLPEFQELVNRFFSSREATTFSDLTPEAQPAAFFNLWTRKEALLKATGEGIGDLLNRVEVSFLPGEPAQVLSFPAEAWANCEWSLTDLAVSPAYTAALAIPVGNVSVVRLEASLVNEDGQDGP